MFEIETSGFDELEKNLKQLSDNAEALDGEHRVTFDELFNQPPAPIQTAASDALFANGGLPSTETSSRST